jgi:hypothetical protein
VIDKSGRLIPGGKVSVYDANDTGNTTLLALTDLNGLPISNPLTASDLSITPDFDSPVPAVKFVAEGGGTLTAWSGVGLLEEATAAKEYVQGIDVAETVTAPVGAPAAVTLDQSTGKFSFTIPQGAKGDKGDRGPIGPGSIPLVEDPNDPGTFNYGTGLAEDSTDPGTFLIGA